MAAPHVAGAAALLLEKDPSLDSEDILVTLQETGVDIYDSRSGLTFKRINVEDALNNICSTSNWQAGSCGAGNCGNDERQYTRTTNPSGCASLTKCEYDASCESGVEPVCEPSDCPSGYEPQGQPTCDDSGEFLICERECFKDDYCDNYGRVE